MALHGAAFRGNARIAETLLNKGADPNIKNKLGGTPLMWAASYGQDEVVRLLLAKGADVNIKDNSGASAADWADKNKQTNLATVLREAQK